MYHVRLCVEMLVTQITQFILGESFADVSQGYEVGALL